MTGSWEWDETLYADAAAHYAAGRMPYPNDLGARIVAATGRQGRALDIGCGPGSLTLQLAAELDTVVGIDADTEMVATAGSLARSRGITNVTWRRLRGEELPAGLGRFGLVTFAQSFHWMDRPRVAATVRRMLRREGACVHVHATTHRGDESSDPLPFPRPPHDAVGALVGSYLGPVRRAGRSTLPGGTAGGEDVIFRAAGFAGPEPHELRHGEVVERSVDQVVAATFSLSSSTPALFGARRDAFETDLGARRRTRRHRRAR